MHVHTHIYLCVCVCVNVCVCVWVGAFVRECVCLCVDSFRDPAGFENLLLVVETSLCVILMHYFFGHAEFLPGGPVCDYMDNRIVRALSVAPPLVSLSLAPPPPLPPLSVSLSTLCVCALSAVNIM
jgi:hypothetical protein